MWIACNPKNVMAGLLFMAVAGLFALQAMGLPLGNAVRMGPGYFPLVLTGLLATLGLVLVATGLRSKGDLPTGIAWRAVGTLTGAVVFFGFAVTPLGFVPTLAITVLAASLASRNVRFGPAFANAAIIAGFCWLVFIKGLGLPLPTLGPWLGGH